MTGQGGVKTPSPLANTLKGTCPRCGQGHLFQGFLKLAPRCDRCGLDYGFADPADGPAFFVMSGVSIVVVTAWAIWAVLVQPPVWVQFAVVVPAVLGASLGALRPVKAWLVAEQFVRKAEEARFESVGKHGEGGFVWDRRKAGDR